MAAEKTTPAGPGAMEPERAEGPRRRVRQKPDPRKPWLRQPGETTKAFAAFQVYCEKRSLRLVAQETGRRSLSTLGEWCSTYDWVERLAALLDWQAEEQRVEQQRIAHEKATKRAALKEELSQRKITLGLRLIEISETCSKLPALGARRVVEHHPDGREKQVQHFHPPSAATIRFGKEGFKFVEDGIREQESSASTHQVTDPDTFQDVPLESEENKKENQ